MAFPPAAPYSKSQINRAGEIIANPEKVSFSDYSQAVEIVDKWRASHGYPMNTFRSTLTAKTIRYKNRLVAQRLKRFPTIADKLHRYPTMQLSRMQDIGGVRAVVRNISDLRDLVSQYEKTRFQHERVAIHDYVDSPRGEDGYRSIHLVYKYSNNLENAKQYNGLRIEVQLRTKLQHNWATAVETMGTIIRQSLKTRGGEKKWLNFFALVSSAFAHIEGTPLVPGYDNLSMKETFRAVKSAEKRLHVIDRLEGMRVVVNHLNTNDNGRYYHLIVLRSLEHRVNISSFRRDEYARAALELAKAEHEAKKLNGTIDPVLVAVSDLKSLKKAYPNYFLDVDDFLKQVRKIVRSV